MKYIFLALVLLLVGCRATPSPDSPDYCSMVRIGDGNGAYFYFDFSNEGKCEDFATHSKSMGASVTTFPFDYPYEFPPLCFKDGATIYADRELDQLSFSQLQHLLCF